MGLALLPVLSAAASEDDAVGAVAKVVDGQIDDWLGASPMIGGQQVVSRGEFLYQDYIYDDLGAFVASARNATGLGGQSYTLTSPAADGQPAGVTMNMRGSTEKAGVGTFVYPDDEARYGNNAADLLQFRAALVGDRVHFLVTLTTLLEPDSTVVGLALGGDGTDPHEWPLGAGITTPGSDHVLTVWGTGGRFDDQPLEAVGGQVAVSVEDNAFEFSVPVDLVGTSFRAYLATGLWDAANTGWLQVQQTRSATAAGGSNGTVPNIFNVAFRHDEEARFGDTGVYANNAWFERAQADALLRSDISTYAADIDLTAADTPPTTITGFHQRIYRSTASTIAPHEGISWAGVLAQNGMNSPTGRWTYHFLGPWLPYSIYVPPVVERMTVMLHGSGNTMLGVWHPGIQRDMGDANRSILVDPLSRGVHNGYAEYADLAVFDAIRDAEAHYPVDPAKTILSGGSMGGIGTYRLLALHPDQFAGAIVWSSCAGGPWAFCTSSEESLELFANYRNVELLIHHGHADPLVPVYSSNLAANKLDELGYRYVMYQFFAGGHTSFVEWDNYRFESAFVARQPTIDPNPPHVTYQTSEGWWSPDISPDLVYDHAYWVSGLRVRDTSLGDRSFGQVDAVTHGRGGNDLVTEALMPASGQGPPNGHLFSGRQAVEPGTPIPLENRFTATLTNLRAAAFDLDRMALHTSSPLTATIDTDGAAEVRLLGSGPVTVDGAAAQPEGDDVILSLPEAGTYEVTVRAG